MNYHSCVELFETVNYYNVDKKNKALYTTNILLFFNELYLGKFFNATETE